MAKNELKSFLEAWETKDKDTLIKENKPASLTESELSDRKKISSELKTILNQRKEQRRSVLNLAMGLTWTSLIFLIAIVLLKIIFRWMHPQNDLFSGYELQILTVAVFGELVGIIAIITKSLWDDSVYIDKM